MPFAIVLIALVAIIFGTVMIATIAKAFFTFLSTKGTPTQAPKSLTTSELHTLIQDAVAEATGPLAERVAALEERTATEALPPARLDVEAIEKEVFEEALNTPQRQSLR